MCTESVMWGWGNKRMCMLKEEHTKHRADIGDQIVEWWGKVGSTHYRMIDKEVQDAG